MRQQIRTLIQAIVILPGTVIIFIPACLLYLSFKSFDKSSLLSGQWYFIALALFFLVVGSALMITTVKLMVTLGQGTPAPWAAPKKLVIAGPYRHVRNPMITGALLFLIAEALLFSSWLIVVWAAVFFILNCLYFPMFEEKELIKRFGQEYLEYKRSVPRWLPRFVPYKKEGV